MSLNLDAVFLPAVCQFLVGSGDSEKLFLKKLIACWSARTLCEKYLEHGIRADLVRTVLEKKLSLIAGAKTAKEVDRASQPPRPRYNYGVWEEDPFCVPEEELIWWSIISLRNTMSLEAKKRYMELFSRVVGHT